MATKALAESLCLGIQLRPAFWVVSEWGNCQYLQRSDARIQEVIDRKSKVLYRIGSLLPYGGLLGQYVVNGALGRYRNQSQHT
jgi:hypothetical protein